MNAGSFIAYKNGRGMSVKKASLLPYIISAMRDDGFLIKKCLLYFFPVKRCGLPHIILPRHSFTRLLPCLWLAIIKEGRSDKVSSDRSFMKFISRLLLIYFMLGLISVYSPQKVLALNYEGITSFQIYQSKANQGDADAQFNLAFLYHRGVGAPRDDRYAIYWYTKAAKQGHVNAQYSLGDLYRCGGGEEIQRDYKKAFYWLTKAAEQGSTNAQYILGDLCQYGGGEEVPRDYKQAFSWYTKAAEQGHYFAKEDRDKMLEKMSQSQIEEVQKLSKKLYEKIYNKAK